ncbi:MULTISPECIES: ATP synthase F1 subunit epsilon [Aliarcobacter]|jgi:F-type H+-transporting ATPase subunit epsilon|uniref:ATP synthase epsilon chain n=7 Tax=Arcobacteraceae TaxID=2808963 RepID=A0AA96DUT6_9BACT|nr:ATP synthase F1 subunit epsilon [Aliarcobacter cryaerophilus]MBK6548323.1 F0F1 ATP synthase subunit epsilon [Arcobacter sp.]NCB10059.1 F0F1 ATP synthase subunit epsilon [Erysipelotrichia bacterium]OQA76068.1 MAG: ATP synthase epsilon chain [Candidatus Dependentiae bacterium ADurb.Bin246]WNL12045.1 ATP synthase F1 subunit epsilon [Arcobacter sp. AZ-2023]WPD03495.1 ATP synthase F1 subunit epsilon [Arcobacter sp. DSM 115972]WPD05536.1 ATP synthase F1 subunit epsilon [Arcobacter sp. DSM 115956
MDTIKLSIVTPTGSIFNGDVKTVTLPGKEGEFGVLPGHSSLVSTLSVGVIVIEKIDSTEAVAINWGHVKVDEKSVDVLVDGAIALTGGKDSEISKNLEAAKELVNSVKDSKVSMAAVEAKINSFA